MATNRQQLEQGRAAFAYNCAEAGVKLKDSSEYKSYVKKIPMLIKTNGLGATMAFVFAKASKDKEGNPRKDNAYGLIYSQLVEWIKSDEKQLIEVDDYKLAKKLTEVDSTTYRAVTVEVLAFFTWLRRFAEGLIDKN